MRVYPSNLFARLHVLCFHIDLFSPWSQDILIFSCINNTHHHAVTVSRFDSLIISPRRKQASTSHLPSYLLLFLFSPNLNGDPVGLLRMLASAMPVWSSKGIPFPLGRPSGREPIIGNGAAPGGTDVQRSALQINISMHSSPDFSTINLEHHDRLGDFKRSSS